MNWRKVLRRIAISVGALVALAAGAWLLFDDIALLTLQVAVARQPHATIETAAFDADGRQLGSVAFLKDTFPVIVRNHRGDAGFGMQYGLGPPRIAVPAEEPVELEMLWTVPGFGRVLVRADNLGKGYVAPPGGAIRIELIPEFARSRLAAVECWVAAHNRGRFASADASAKAESARSLLDAVDRSGTPRERAQFALTALRLGLEAGESEVLAEARNYIAEHRRGSLSVKVLDARGRPVANVEVDAREERADFLFGVFHYGYGPEDIRELKALGTNYATLHMNWRQMEPTEGDYSFRAFDGLFNPAALKANCFVLRGHALTWLLPLVLPDYMNRYRGNRDALAGKVREHVDAIVKRYNQQVDIWEANNEGHAVWASFGLTRDGMDEVIRASAQELRRLAPGKPIMINAAAVLGENVPLEYYPLLPRLTPFVGPFSIDPYAFFEELTRAGVPFDEIGLQYYYAGRTHPPFAPFQQPAIDLFRFAESLERYSTLGKPIEITEVSVGSSHREGDSYWHAPANKVTQADWLEGVFTLAYGSPAVRAVNWWDIYDRDSFIEDGALIDKSGRPKLAWMRLHSLLQGWRTDVRAKTSRDGVANLSGAPGNYRVDATIAGLGAGAEAHIRQGGSDSITIAVPSNRHGRGY